MIRVVVAAVFTILVCAVTSLSCYGFEDLDDPDLRIFDGHVVAVDVTQSTLTAVYGDMSIVFPVSLDTKLVRDALDIKLSDFGAGDYVTVEYVRSGSKSRVPLKATKITLVYDASER